jgi:hypothetical protein
MGTLAAQEAQEAQILVEVEGQWLFRLEPQHLVALGLQSCVTLVRNAELVEQ